MEFLENLWDTPFESTVIFTIKLNLTLKLSAELFLDKLNFWAMIGKAALDNSDLPIDFVRDLMIAKGEGKSLATPFIPQSKH